MKYYFVSYNAITKDNANAFGGCYLSQSPYAGNPNALFVIKLARKAISKKLNYLDLAILGWKEVTEEEYQLNTQTNESGTP